MKNIIRYVYKFSDKGDEKYENVFKLIKQDDNNNNKITKFLIDSSIKEDKSNIIIKNALKRF